MMMMMMKHLGSLWSNVLLRQKQYILILWSHDLCHSAEYTLVFSSTMQRHQDWDSKLQISKRNYATSNSLQIFYRDSRSLLWHSKVNSSTRFTLCNWQYVKSNAI